MTTPNPKIVELPKDQLEALLHRAEAALREDDYERIKALAEAYAYLTELLEAKGTTIERLGNLLFSSRTEKTRDVVSPTEEDGSAEADAHPERTEGIAPGTRARHQTQRARAERCRCQPGRREDPSPA